MDPLPEPTAVPAPLRDRDQWVCWRTQDRGGKQTKVPIDPHRGGFASTTDADTWTDFESARAFAADSESDGVGFVFTADDPFVGVDLDDCRVPATSSLHDWAADIVDELDSYTEVSPSGTGVHVLVRGSLPDGRNRKGDVECYEDARFFTVTGEVLADAPTTIAEREEELQAVHGRHVDETDLENEPATPNSDTPAGQCTPDSSVDVGIYHEQASEPEGGSDLDDDELVARAKRAANGEKFSRLWSGDTGGYDSHSEADMALCSLLAFWTGGDHERVDRLFRLSGLLREKWDERHFADGSTYGEKTIERAIAGTTEFYSPSPAGKTDGADADRPATAADDQIESESDDQAGTESDDQAGTEHDGRASRPTECSPPSDLVALRGHVERLEAELQRLENTNAELRAALQDERDRRAELEERLSGPEGLIDRFVDRVTPST